MKFEKTKMLKRYMLRLALRIVIFLCVFVLYLVDKQHIWRMMTDPIFFGVSPIRFVWLVFMIIMVQHLFPNKLRSMALRKEEKKYFQPAASYSEMELLKFVQIQNIRAWQVMLIWLSFNSIFGLLYLAKVLDEADLFMLTVFFFLCDYICILFFCPFQTYIMKNRCRYQPGALKAVTYDSQGSVLSQKELVSGKGDMHLQIRAEKEKICADGKSLCYLFVEAVDEDGVLCPSAEEDIEVTVSGAACLQGIGTARPYTDVSFGDPNQKLFLGRCQIVLRARTQPGEAVVTVTRKHSDEVFTKTIQVLTMN